MWLCVELFLLFHLSIVELVLLDGFKFLHKFQICIFFKLKTIYIASLDHLLTYFSLSLLSSPMKLISSLHRGHTNWFNSASTKSLGTDSYACRDLCHITYCLQEQFQPYNSIQESIKKEVVFSVERSLGAMGMDFTASHL